MYPFSKVTSCNPGRRSDVAGSTTLAFRRINGCGSGRIHGLMANFGSLGLNRINGLLKQTQGCYEVRCDLQGIPRFLWGTRIKCHGYTISLSLRKTKLRREQLRRDRHELNLSPGLYILTPHDL